ncbi:glycosyltransferase family 2 protein [Sphingobacterium rhinopitheci]|uniref:glycosyltransferase family 2 protein n=1 Tax=Sphingobacterium rhinopitheci TaxID=2781960 RepID=UPI001F524157|nr:glycosyltransferase [Sphingobacterium rhinopitheci]MCI0920762.1 glycosyltransferase [Sphingobacterium rhinopitheci]
MNNLAIIIPAYKSVYLKATLESLRNQTDKRFTVYIGDDCSPDDLEAIIQPCIEDLDIVYYRFEDNLGGKDLIGQWNRCLDLITDEPWFIMFSDDDIIGNNCIEHLFAVLDIIDVDVFHFNIKIIDKNGNVLKVPNEYPERLTSVDFFELLYHDKIDARMPEFVFKTNTFKELGGFVEFPMAMRSDNATVMQIALDKGIYTIPGSYVYWRDSGINVSSSSDSSKYVIYYEVLVDFFHWYEDFIQLNSLKTKWDRIEMFLYLRNYGVNIEYIIGKDERIRILKSYRNYPKKISDIPFVIQYYIKRIKKKLFP